ncbi:MAG TPA: ABC transporter permease [Candidatus Angelobacter sp.]|nr:ABC transporter permease [Candidatus Angelobacter sp.]
MLPDNREASGLGRQQSGGGLWWDNLLRDLRYTLRTLRHSPGFTIIAVLTIALGIGATTAIFSIVDAALLRPLPYPEPEQLVFIQDDLPGIGSQDVGISIPELWDFQRSGIFQWISPNVFDANNLTGSGQPTQVLGIAVMPNYFTLLGVKPQLGRTFDPNDPTPGFNLESVISDGLWKRAFGSDPHILGKTIRVDGDSYQIVGVMPPDFHNPGRTPGERNTEVFLAGGFAAPPFTPSTDPPRRDSHWPGTIARLKSGLTLAAAQNRIDALVASLQKQFPKDYPAQAAWTVRLVPLKETVVGDVRRSLLLLFGAVGLVLLIGCVNVANLLLARASARGREMAIRQALGAARRQLVRQLLTESLFLSLLGGTAGLAILFFSRGFLLRLVPNSLPQLNEISISWTVLLFALGASLLTGVFFGLAPALHAGKTGLTHVLKQEGRGSTRSGRQVRTRRLLVIGEFAVSLVLMIAASLLLHSFWDLLNVRLGFNPQNVMVLRTKLPDPNDPKANLYGTPAQEAPFLREILRRSKTLPGVEEAALGDIAAVPLDHDQRDLYVLRVIFQGRGMQTTNNDAPLLPAASVLPEYFHLMGITLLRGRLFTDLDHENAPEVAVINEAMAKTYWPGEDPLGKHFKLSVRASTWITVVGIVADARTDSLEKPSVPQIYAPLYQRSEHHLAIFLRGRLDTAAIPGQVRELVQSVNPELPVFGAETLNEVVSASLSVRRFSMEMIGLFALTALLLAGIGIYGVISFIVSERTHEIGIYFALGAQQGKIMKMVLHQGLTLAIVGAAVGLVGALIVSHLMAGLLYGVRPADPVIFTGVTTVLTMVAFAACYIPARRAIRVDPIVALRYE